MREADIDMSSLTLSDIKNYAREALEQSDLDWTVHKSFDKEDLLDRATRAIILMAGMPKSYREFQLMISLIFVNIENSVMWHYMAL